MRNKSWLYTIPPIDDFTGVFSLEHTTNRTFMECLSEAISDFQFADIHWTSTTQEFIFALPGDHGTALGVIIKEQDNGTTYVWSPIPLPHLNDICFDVCMVETIRTVNKGEI